MIIIIIINSILEVETVRFVLPLESASLCES